MQGLMVRGPVPQVLQLLGVSLEDALFESGVSSAVGECVLQGGDPQGGEVLPAHEEPPEPEVEFGDHVSVGHGLAAAGGSCTCFGDVTASLSIQGRGGQPVGRASCCRPGAAFPCRGRFGARLRPWR